MPRLTLLCWLCWLALALPACTVTAPGADAPEAARGDGSEPEPARPAPEPDPEQIKRLLWAAEDAVAADHLTYPASGSALLLYDQVLALDPDNVDARRGIEIVVERFLGRAHEATERRQFVQAEIEIDRARAVDPEHPGIAPAEARIRLLRDADRRIEPLDAAALGSRSDALAARLTQLGAELRRSGCRARIHARNDAEGRWLYHQLSGPAGSERIRAELHIGAPPRIEVLCIAQE